jgi:hypothetical protein
MTHDDDEEVAETNPMKDSAISSKEEQNPVTYSGLQNCKEHPWLPILSSFYCQLYLLRTILAFNTLKQSLFNLSIALPKSKHAMSRCTTT